MSERVTYTVRYSYLVENQREDWKRLEALLSEKLSELSQRFIAVRIELIRHQQEWDVTYDRGDSFVDDSHSEEAWDWAWDQMAKEA